MSVLFNLSVIEIYQPLLIQIASKRLLLESPKVQFHTFMYTPAQLCVECQYVLFKLF